MGHLTPGKDEKTMSKTTAKEKKSTLRESLCYTPRTAADVQTAPQAKKADAFCRDYMRFLDKGKTEHECVLQAKELAAAAGFVPYTFGCKVKPGDKFYYDNRGKSLHLFVIGSEPLECGIRLAAAHIDSPRLDLKPSPLYEESGMAFFKTHYYGGIRKYQWPTLPLALHGTVVLKNGKSVDICIGEEAGDPVFCITDLLPHLAQEQSAKRLSEAVSGESLNAVLGTVPMQGEEGEDLIKLHVLQLLNEKYGITEEDLITSELCFVPAAPAREVGFDRSLIGSYGHDDRVCAYPMLRALLESNAPQHTVYAILADKEETGSNGVSGMQCDILTDLIDDLSAALGANPRAVRAASACLSADVNAAFDPNFASVYDKRNSSYINRGVVVTKYTGARGKSGTSDASAAFFGFVRRAFESEQVLWQTGELGKVDAGGGGTVAMYIAKHNIDTIDIGVAVLSMHAPFELVTKFDVYETYRGVKAFLQYTE